MAKQPKSKVEQAVLALTATLQDQYRASQQIERSTDGKIHLPDWMTPKDAADALLKYDNGMVEEVQEEIKLVGHVDDCLNASTAAIENSFGQALGSSQKIIFFGFEFVIPAESRTITIGFNETRNVPIGRIEIPGLPLILDIQVKEDKRDVSASTIVMVFSYKRMFQPLVDKIKAEARRVLRHESIFKGKAINSDYTFINLDSFDVSRIVYSVQEKKDLTAFLFNYISNYASFTKDGLPSKRIILLTGKYGTGKTLTALKTAKVCDESKWTFINVMPGHDIVMAIETAKKFQPAALFFEDIDAATDTDKRDERMNSILNTLDGTLSKDAKIVVVLTTNHLNRVNRAMIRPGRIDAFIEMGTMDEESIVGLVRAYLSPEVAESCDPAALLHVANDFTPAFVVEALSRSKLYASAEGRTEITESDIVHALRGIRVQFEEMMKEQEVDRGGLQQDFEVVVKSQVDMAVEDAFKAFEQKLHPKVFAEKE